MAFYLEQDDAMLMQNDEVELSSGFSEKMLNYFKNKMGLANSQT